MSEITWRPMLLADAAEAATLCAAAEQLDDTGEHYDADDLAEELSAVNLDLERDTMAVCDGASLVAMGQVHGMTEVRDVHSVYCWGVVHPEWRGRGIGRQLLGWQLDRAAAVHAERHPTRPARLELRCGDQQKGAIALATAAGLQPVRYWFDMERELGDELPEARALAAPLLVTPYDAGRDEDVRLAHNEAFAGHFGSTLRDPATWRQWFTGSRSFRPDLSFLVVDGPAIAGYLLSYVHEADAVARGFHQGYVGQLGTLAPWRGRGVGTALLGAALEGYRQAGFRQATLGVDSANGTGALDLYRRLGFEVTRSQTSWVREIKPG